MPAAVALALLAALAPARSVLLVTVDTHRGDYLSAVDAERVATPNLDALAARGTLFTNARAPVPLTLPSHASLLTGLYPPEHGVRDNGAFRLGDARETLAEVLKSRGFETAAFVSSFVLDRRFGLAQGFDVYDDALDFSLDELESPTAERPAEAVLDAFEAWHSARESGRPFFAWVHFYDPHAPYEPPEPHRSRYPDDPYAGEVAYVDATVGKLLALTQPESTLVVVTGDHGEGLGEHGETTHALLIYNSTLHVPLILAGPGVPEGRRDERLVRTLDVGATVLDLLGVERGLGSGVSLEEPSSDRTAYSESLYGFRHFGFSPLYGLERDGHRFIDAPARELYRVEVDSGETRNLLEEDRPRSRAMFRQLNELRERLGSVAGESVVVDDETRRKLESLGYVAGSARPFTDVAGLPDPKSELSTYESVQRAEALRGANECERALAALEGVSTGVIKAVEIRAQCHIELERWPEARAVLEQALERGHEASWLHLSLGIVCFREGRLEEAERELRIALALDETSVTAHYHLGNTLRARRSDTRAAEAYRRALAINPEYVFAWNGLGMTLARTGDDAGALEAFREATRRAALEPLSLFNLAIQLERMGRSREALESYREFLERSDPRAAARERARAEQALRRLSPD